MGCPRSARRIMTQSMSNMKLRQNQSNKLRGRFISRKERIWKVSVDHLARFRDSFLLSDHSHMSVNDMCVSFKSEVLLAIERLVPTKMTKTKYSLPWIDHSIKRLIRKREKLYSVLESHSEPLQTVQSTCTESHQRCIFETYFQYLLL